MMKKKLNSISKKFALQCASIAMISLWGLFPQAAKAMEEQAEMFDNKGIYFVVDTAIEFEFIQSNGAYQSTLGVINLKTGEKTPLLSEVKPSDSFQDVNTPSDYREDLTPNDTRDFKGTPGNTVPQPLAKFTFKANTPYALYLESFYNGRSAGIVYSTNTRNQGGNQQFLFDGNFFKLGDGGIFLRIDDTGAALVRGELQDSDFDDFIVGIGGHLACPFAQSNADTNTNISQSSVKSEKEVTKRSC